MRADTRIKGARPGARPRAHLEEGRELAVEVLVAAVLEGEALQEGVQGGPAGWVEYLNNELEKTAGDGGAEGGRGVLKR